MPDDEDENGPRVGVDDRVVFLTDIGPEFGTVRWIGHIPGQDTHFLAGVEFDNPIGQGNGVYSNRRLFQAKQNHASLLPLDGLLREDEYFGSEAGRQKGDSDSTLEGLTQSRSRTPDFPLSSRGPVNVDDDDDDNDPAGHYEEDDDVLPRSTPRSTPLYGGDIVTTTTGSSSPSEAQYTYSNNTSDDAKGDLLLTGRRQRSESVEESSLSQDYSPTKGCAYQNRHTEHHRLVPSATGGDSPPALPPPPYNNVRSASPPPTPPRRAHLIETPKFDRLSSHLSCSASDVDIGTLVTLKKAGGSHYGVIRWLGYLSDLDEQAAGIELEQEMLGASNGWYKGTQYFACPEDKAVFVPLNHVALDERFSPATDSHEGGSSDSPQEVTAAAFGGIECPIVPGFVAPLKIQEVAKISGRNRGIQGHQNSCYLDATLFAMFAFTSVFDGLLYRPPSPDDIEEYVEVQRVLREEIVNPLRKNLFVRADRVMKLRTFLDNLTSVRGLCDQEKDPEELLNSLLTQTLRASPYLRLSSGQEAHLYQLFVERDPELELPTVQELFEQSIHLSDIKLRSVPSVLILQMPRFGRQFKVYDRVMPSQILDVTDIIEDAPRQCIICGLPAALECRSCFRELGSGMNSTAFCCQCHTHSHAHARRRDHKPVRLNVPHEYLNQRSSNAPPRLYMELFAVVCIETSHYVSFVKCGLGPDAPWCFFDSMADRKGEVNGYNIPEVVPADDLPYWLSDEGHAQLKDVADDKALPVQARRFVCDAYMCFYQSSEVSMYQ